MKASKNPQTEAAKEKIVAQNAKATNKQIDMFYDFVFDLFYAFLGEEKNPVKKAIGSTELLYGGAGTGTRALKSADYKLVSDNDGFEFTMPSAGVEVSFTKSESYLNYYENKESGCMFSASSLPGTLVQTAPKRDGLHGIDAELQESIDLLNDIVSTTVSIKKQLLAEFDGVLPSKFIEKQKKKIVK